MKTNGETICENCGKPSSEHTERYLWCGFGMRMFKPKPEQPAQLPKRPATWRLTEGSMLERSGIGTLWVSKKDFDSQDAKIAELEKELRVYKKALDYASSRTDNTPELFINMAIEAARKEQNGE